MELIEGAETSTFRTQTPGNHPKESILHKEHGETLKSMDWFIFRLSLSLFCYPEDNHSWSKRFVSKQINNYNTFIYTRFWVITQSIPTFRYKISVPSSKVKKPKKGSSWISWPYSARGWIKSQQYNKSYWWHLILYSTERHNNRILIALLQQDWSLIEANKTTRSWDSSVLLA